MVFDGGVVGSASGFVDGVVVSFGASSFVLLKTSLDGNVGFFRDGSKTFSCFGFSSPFLSVAIFGMVPSFANCFSISSILLYISSSVKWERRTYQFPSLLHSHLTLH